MLQPRHLALYLTIYHDLLVSSRFGSTASHSLISFCLDDIRRKHFRSGFTDTPPDVETGFVGLPVDESDPASDSHARSSKWDERMASVLLQQGGDCKT